MDVYYNELVKHNANYETRQELLTYPELSGHITKSVCIFVICSVEVNATVLASLYNLGNKIANFN